MNVFENFPPEKEMLMEEFEMFAGRLTKDMNTSWLPIMLRVLGSFPNSRVEFDGNTGKLMRAKRLEKMFSIEMFKNAASLGNPKTAQNSEQKSSDVDSVVHSNAEVKFDWKILMEILMSRAFLIFFKKNALIWNKFFLSDMNLATDTSRYAGG